MQKNGAGLHTASSCYWDNSSDGMIIHLLNQTDKAQFVVILQSNTKK